MEIAQLDHLVLTVTDIDASVDFYTRVLGMIRESFIAADGSERLAVKFGSQKINFHQQGAEFEPKAQSALVGTADLCFVSHTELSQVVVHIGFCGEQVIEGPVRRTGARGPIESIYLRDPDGNLIEICQYVDALLPQELTW